MTLYRTFEKNDTKDNMTDAFIDKIETDDVKPKKPKKIRCNVCNKKLGLIPFSCRCSGDFCARHRHPDTHECDFDFKTNAIENLRKHNPRIVAEKIIKI